MLAPPQPVPALSVIIPAVNGPAILLECLNALRRNGNRSLTLEVLVIERTGVHTRNALAIHAPDVLIFPVPENTPIPRMRAIGVRHARAEAVAVIEDHVLVPDDWAQRLLDALASGADVVGGSVYNAATSTTVDWASFLCEYSHLLAPRAGRDVVSLTGNNVAYRRTLVQRYSAVLDAGGWEDRLHDALRDDGIALSCVPDIAVAHKMHYRMRDYLSQRYLYSRAFAGGAAIRLAPLRRAFLTARSACLPPVLLARIMFRVLVSRRHRREFLLSLPLIAVFVCAWAAGEAVGYAAGPGDALAKVR